ncbi:MAG: STN domain-containing protein, partial [Elusimicrobiota bacterium]|nr:STN domain-containing protein [Elusimicrobiota bacterium]
MNKKSIMLFSLAFGIMVPLGVNAQIKTDAKASVVQDLSYDNTGFSQAGGEASIYKEVESNSPLDRKVTIRVNNMPIGTVLSSISTQAKINFVMSEEFTGKKVTASLGNVTVREALDTLLRLHGLAYQRIGKSDSYLVTKRSEDAPDAVTKVYTLNYVSLQGQSSAAQDLQSLLPKDTSS